MSKTRIISIVTAVILLFSCMAAGSAAEINVSNTLIGGLTFSKTSLTAGTLSANVTLLHSGAAESEKIALSIGYYDTDGTLLDFEASVLESSPFSMGYSASAAISISIPASVSEGQYVKVIAMDAVTLMPYTFQQSPTLTCGGGFINGVETGYKGLYERYYTLDSAEGSISIANRKVLVDSVGTPLRLKNMGDGEVSFENSESPKDRLRYVNTSGNLSTIVYLPGNSVQRWKLEETENGYYIAHADGGYFAIENGTAVVREEPYEFQLNLVGETPFTLATSLPGYELLTAAQKQRMEEIYTSVGADVFPSSTNSDSYLDIGEKVFEELYENRETMTAEAQKEKILETMALPLFSSLVDVADVENIPGGDAIITQADPVKETFYVWDLGTKEYNCIEVTYTTADSVQKVKVYCEDVNYANVQPAIEALGKFPYEYRKYITTINVYESPDGNSAYYCDGKILTVRLAFSVNAAGMARGFAHELGHSVDLNSNGHWSAGDTWKQCVANDIVTISGYGNTNYDEGFAELSRLYFQSYGNRDRQLGIQQLFPNQFASFGRMLDKIGMEHLY